MNTSSSRVRWTKNLENYFWMIEKYYNLHFEPVEKVYTLAAAMANSSEAVAITHHAALSSGFSN